MLLALGDAEFLLATHYRSVADCVLEPDEAPVGRLTPNVRPSVGPKVFVR